MGAERPEPRQVAGSIPFPSDLHALSQGELQRGPVLQHAVRPFGVVFSYLQPSQSPGVVNMVEYLLIQELIPQGAVEPLVPSVLPG